MPALFIYLIKVNIALLIFCAGYYAVLRHLTFYNLNRIYLVTAILFSTLYPMLDMAAFLNQHEQIAQPVQVIIIDWQAPVKSVAATFLGHDKWYWLQMLFWAGVCLFSFRLLTQLLSLYRLHKRSEPARIQQYVIRIIKGNINPFSFWRNIYINPENHPPHELNAILEHEQIHVSEWHTLDILLSELSTIFYWFNPGVWLMKRAVRENIEFITDQKILQKGVDSKAYQYSLLNVNFGAQSNAIVNHFNISTIKKRIMMMNAKRSSKINVTRYLFLIPAVLILLLVFSVSKAELVKAAKHSDHLIKSFKTAAAKIGIGDDKPAAPANAMANTRSIKRDTITGKDIKKIDLATPADTNKIQTVKIMRIVPDSNKTRVVITGGMDKIHPDYYVNGVKVSETEFHNIDPEKIASIAVDKDHSKNGTVSIITKGHEDKSAHLRIYNDTSKLQTVTVIGYRIDGDKVITRGHGFNNDDITITKSIKNGDTTYDVRPRQTVIIKHGKGMDNAKANASSTFSIGPRSIGGSTGSTAINNISDKLIIIDGKEATKKQLKKVSAADIESISILKNESATAIYGDKGKNGVILITTKKKL